MKLIFNRIAVLTVLVLSVTSVFAQVTPNGNSGSSITSYTSGAANDPIYIWCADGLSNNTASLTANAPSGTGPWTYSWFYHDQTNFSWSPYFSETATSSTISNVPSDGYRVQIYDAGGVLVGCYIAWVWNMNSDVTASNSPTVCDATNLNGTINVNGSFTYYNPPPPESLITASTEINVCFSANHTYVSDLGFYLIGPPACGSPVISVMPHPQLINASNGCCCNSGNNVSNLCFTTNLVGNISPCLASVPLSGTYSGYSSAYGDNVTINWSSLYGCNAAEGGWSVQIYDCIGADVGALTNATLTFSNLTSMCGSPTSISYTSGAINSAINDNSCSAGTASIFQVPITPNLTTPFTINASTSYLWTASQAVTIPNAASSLTPAVATIPTGTTEFTLTATISYGSTVCTNDAVTSFVNACCTAIADAGANINACASVNTQIGTPSVANMTYSWSPSTNLSDATAAQPAVSITNSGGAPIITTYTLTVTNTVDGNCTATDDITISVTPAPALTITNDATICLGDCIDLTISGADFYSWTPEIGIVDTTLQTQNVCPTATTTYTVEGYVIGGTSVTNGDFSGGAVGFTSDYTLNSNTQTEGTYFVTTNANLTHPGFTGVDHTTGTGNFLVVNGSSTPNSSVWCQTFTVEPNTDYVFSTWVSTLAIGSPAIMQFSINGTVLSSPFTAPSVTGQWDEFYATWNSGAATTATICIVNQNTSLGGNDFGLDDIFFSSVCSATESVTITVNQPANATITQVGPYCTNASPVTLIAAQTGGTWSGPGITNASTGAFNPTTAGAGTHTITYTIADPCGDSDAIQIVVNAVPTADAGTYSTVCVDASDIALVGTPAGGAFSGTGVNGNLFDPSSGSQTITYSYTDANGCSDTDTELITINPLPTINAGADVTVCVGDDVTLSGSGGQTYSWSNGVNNGQVFNPGLGILVYTVTGTDANGCINTDDVSVTVLEIPVASISSDISSGYPVLDVVFTNNSTGGTLYGWNFGNGQISTVSTTASQSVSYGEPGTYVIELVAGNGYCSDLDTLHIIVIPLPDPIIHVPNVFTPNGDDANDEFIITTEYVSEMNVIILNRWGNVVHQIETLTDGWDGQINGKDANDGVYFFKYTVVGINGKELQGHGNITLVR